jgi:hypothetical protein
MRSMMGQKVKVMSHERSRSQLRVDSDRLAMPPTISESKAS